MPTLSYDFAVVGAKNVERAFASIEQRAIRHNLKMAQAFGQTGGSSRGRGASTGRSLGQSRSQLLKLDERQRIAAEKTVQREQIKTTRQAEAQAKRLQRLRYRQAQADIRFAQRQRKEAQKAAAVVMRERRRVAGSIFGQVGRSSGGALRAVGATAAGALAIGGGFAMSNAVGQQMRETAMASQLANQAGTPGIKKTLLRESQGVRGLSGEEVLSGLTSFTDLTGDLDTARRLVKDIAMFSHATGAEFEDATAMAGSFANMLKDIKDPAKKAEAILRAMYGAGGAAQKGAVEVKDIAGMGGAITAIAGRFSGDKVNALQTASALTQVAMTKSKSPEEAVTAASNFVDMIGTKADKLEGMGLGSSLQKDSAGNVTAINDPVSLIAGIFEKTNGDLGTMTQLFGQRGQRVIEGFRGAFESGGSAGIYKQFNELFGASLTGDQVAARAQSRLEDPDMVIKEVVKDFNAQVGRELLPVLAKLIPEFAKLLPSVATAAGVFAKLVERLVDSPLTSIGTLIAGKIAMDIAAARIGEGIKSAITGSISGSSGGTGSKSKGGGGGGFNLSGAVFNGVTIGAATAFAIYSTGVVQFEAQEVQMDQAGDRLSRVRELVATGDPANLPEIMRLINDQSRETVDIQEKNDATEKTFGDIGDAAWKFLTGPIGGMFGGDDTGRKAAIGVSETLGFSNQEQESTNEGFLEEMRTLARLMIEQQKKNSEAADKINQGGDKLLQAASKPSGFVSLSRPPQST